VTRIVLAGGGTGGHLMPALALAGALRQLRPEVEPVLVGAERGVEAKILPERPYRFHLLPAEPIYRRQWWRNARWPLLLPRVLRAAGEVLEREEAALVVGTGGYVAGPILYAAHRRGVPIALQEQNAAPGIATRWAARWARQIHVGLTVDVKGLRTGAGTTIYRLGTPIDAPEPVDPVAARGALGIPATHATVLVVGGSQGARALNEAVAEALDGSRLRGAAVLWSTGHATYPRFARLHRPPDVQVRAFWDPIAAAYAAADLVVSRAGALTLAEITAWGLPGILVPLPTAAADHQTANAVALERVGAAVHLPEARLTAETLVAAVDGILADGDRRSSMAAAARGQGRPRAATDIAERLLDLL
jgi:UDP-N-acetylglucosamine--N-acetylmuramyl-(pentapeptide) pyrophosphoryl-undecaprenol N-acetylglucosamine transferase